MDLLVDEKIDKRRLRRQVIVDGKKQCTGKYGCSEWKPVGEFPRQTVSNQLLGTYCRTCGNKMRRERLSRPGQKERKAEQAMMSRYGITSSDHQSMLVEQNNRCWVNNKYCKGGLCIDHCHKTGVVRGLLCNAHNLALGLLGDNVEGVKQLAHYIQMTANGFTPPPKENDSRTHEDMIQITKENPPPESWYEEEFVR